MLADNAREDHFDETENRNVNGNSSSRDVNLKIDAWENNLHPIISIGF